MGSFVQLPLTLAPALERPTRRVIAGVPCLGGLMAATPSGICRGRLNGNGGTSQETGNSRSQKHFLPHRITPFRMPPDKSNKAWACAFRLAAKRHLFPADPHLGGQKLLLRFENGLFHVGQIGRSQNLVDSLVGKKRAAFVEDR